MSGFSVGSLGRWGVLKLAAFIMCKLRVFGSRPGDLCIQGLGLELGFWYSPYSARSTKPLRHATVLNSVVVSYWRFSSLKSYCGGYH